MPGKCWLIGDHTGRFPAIAAQFARLRNMEVEFRTVDRVNGFPHISPGPRNLIAVDFDVLDRFDVVAKRRLKRQIERGAILYVRGGFDPGRRCTLEPFADGEFEVATVRRSASYEIAELEIVNAILRGESSRGDFAVPGAHGLTRAAEVLLLADHRDKAERPAVFGFRCGAGRAIFDLHQDIAGPDDLLICRLAHPAERHSIVGALIAVDTAAGLDPDRAVSFNLTVDDRPANYDYFCAGALRRFLEHVRRRLPGTHVDFAWTPDQNRPSRRYIDTLKEFNTGFVWHGFLRHVDHRTIPDPEREFEQGRRLVSDIAERYQVRFQPVMVFPFEKDTPECVEVLRDGNFIAKAEIPAAPQETELNSLHMRFVSPGAGDEEVTTLPRHTVPELDYEHMLAICALGMPLIAHAHPRDIALRRIARRSGDAGSVGYFDEVLDFAARKSLVPKSLEAMAVEAAL
jgi:hypothetical protein